MSARGGWLCFDLLRRRYALAAETVASVARAREILPVPRAPRGVLGLAERRGRVLTVLDVAQLLDDLETGEERVLVILQPPLGHLALQICGHVSLEPETDAENVRRIDPQALLATLSAAPAP